jgi:hypothetical protein
MGDWIDNAKQREQHIRSEETELQRAQREKIAGLKVVFPEWLNALGAALQTVCDRLSSAFPHDLSRHYSVNQTASGFILRSQGYPEITAEVQFQLDVRPTMIVRHSVTQNLHAQQAHAKQNNGDIELRDSQILIHYSPLVRDPSGEFQQKRNSYTNPELLANDLLREVTRL